MTGYTWSIFAQEWNFDRTVKLWFDHLSHPCFDIFFGRITQLGSPLAFVLLGIIALVVLLRLRRALQGIILNLCLIVSWAVMSGLKMLFTRPRPLGEQLTYATGYSFPSGHAMVSMAFYGFLAYLVWINLPGKQGKCWAGSLVFLVFLIGVSRIYLNVHYASDVLAGFLLGGLMVYMFVRFYRYLMKSS